MPEVVDLDAAGSPRPVAVLALSAQDAEKDDLLRLIRSHRGRLEGARVVATGTTGRALGGEVDLDIETMSSGPLGSDLQIGARIVEGRIDAVIFLRDPLTAHPHEPDIQALLKVCDTHSAPAATNVASAEILLHFLADHLSRVAEGRRFDPVGRS